jgi:hypothetical protein
MKEKYHWIFDPAEARIYGRRGAVRQYIQD